MVVLHPLSTSNHNTEATHLSGRRVVLHPLSTSNHNKTILRVLCRLVVLHPLSTSNHNSPSGFLLMSVLYCILFLHQTTTGNPHIDELSCCIASSFYIKPQPVMHGCIASSFYIKPQRRTHAYCGHSCCIASSFYIKPQRVSIIEQIDKSCIASSFYIKPQPRTPDTLIFRHLTASRHDTKRGGVHRGSRFDAVFTFSTNIRKIIFTEIRRCMSVQRAGARLRSDSSEANI